MDRKQDSLFSGHRPKFGRIFALLGCVTAAAGALALPAAGERFHARARESGPSARLLLARPLAPLVAGSQFALRPSLRPVRYVVRGPGRIVGDVYHAPAGVTAAATATIVAATPTGTATLDLTVVPPPRGAILAVASYDDGICFHSAASGALVAELAIDGGAADVLHAGDTYDAVGATAPEFWQLDTRLRRLHIVGGVPTGDEIATLGTAAFVTNRDVAGDGALTRVVGNRAMLVRTGETAEGIAIDARRGLIYVADVNGPDVAIVDARTLRRRGSFRVESRPFAIALAAGGRTLYVASNARASARDPHAGTVSAYDVANRIGRLRAQSQPLDLPLGLALDAARRRIFATEEGDASVAVLDATTLAAAHAPLPACAIPWRPAFDAANDRLYVPCAGANAVAVIDAARLRTVTRFATGGYPLAVAPPARSGA